MISSFFQRRTAIGLISIALVVVWVVTLVAWPEKENITVLSAACMRVGMLMFGVWLAYPILCKWPPWFYRWLLFGTILVAIRPAMLLLIIPATFLLWMCYPRKSK